MKTQNTFRQIKINALTYDADYLTIEHDSFKTVVRWNFDEDDAEVVETTCTLVDQDEVSFDYLSNYVNLSLAVRDYVKANDPTLFNKMYEEYKKENNLN